MCLEKFYRCVGIHLAPYHCLEISLHRHDVHDLLTLFDLLDSPRQMCRDTLLPVKTGSYQQIAHQYTLGCRCDFRLPVGDDTDPYLRLFSHISKYAFTFSGNPSVYATSLYISLILAPSIRSKSSRRGAMISPAMSMHPGLITYLSDPSAL